MPRYYPIALNIEGRNAVVIGGGAVARRKIETLRACGAVVRVVAPRACREVQAWADQGEITLIARAYVPEDLNGAFLVIAATDSPAENERIAAAARARGALVNSVAPPDVSDFWVGAGIQRGDLLISVFTGGSSPALARQVRAQLEEQFGPEYGKLAALLGSLRVEVGESPLDARGRAAVWHRILDSDVLSLLRAGRDADAAQRARAIFQAAVEEEANRDNNRDTSPGR